MMDKFKEYLAVAPEIKKEYLVIFSDNTSKKFDLAKYDLHLHEGFVCIRDRELGDLKVYYPAHMIKEVRKVTKNDRT